AEGLEVVNVLPGERMTMDNFAVFNTLSDLPGVAAVTSSVENGADEFSITFRALKAGALNQMLRFGHRITRSEAYTPAGSLNEIALRFNGAGGQVLTGAGFELLQNTPNPMKSSTNISFNLPDASEATLTISNVEGRILKVIKGRFAKGLNTVTVQRSDLEAGVLFYQLDTPSNSAVKKMIVTE
ncbi:MAG: T9SS type A sorting domain-containing protein, partial [Saprospiraceae bacterium]|nr:T9SS type A sorting domain-containing protein [Saprospiraceae bacterium]